MLNFDVPVLRTGFHTLDKETHVKLSRRGGYVAHNPSTPKHKRCHEFTSSSAREAANKRWAKRSEKESCHSDKEKR